MTAKLGLKPGFRVYLDRVPGTVRLDWPADVDVLTRLTSQPVDIAWCFCPDRRRLDARIDILIAHVVTNGAVWISWPKKSSGMAIDLDENVVRDVGLTAGVVDVKVAAVDDTWSALKFVRRLVDR